MFVYKIKKLKLERYRCFFNLEMKPISGINVLVGADDIGKSTILEAIEMVLKQDQTIELFESDFHLNNCAMDFRIQVTIVCIPMHNTLPVIGMNQPRLGAEAGYQPTGDLTSFRNAEKRFTLSVVGTKDLKLVCGKPKCKGMNKAELDTAKAALADTCIVGNETLGQFKLQSLVTSIKNGVSQSTSSELGGNEVVSPGAQSVRLDSLNKALQEMSLPGIISGSENGVVDNSRLSDLMLADELLGTPVPFLNCGEGIKRIIPQLVTILNQKPNAPRPINEFGGGKLDFIRQRNYFNYLNQSDMQSFVVLKDLEVAKLAEASAVHLITPAREIVQPKGNRITHYLQTQPNLFNAKLVIFAEGRTEVGFVKALLTLVLGREPASLGIIVCDGTGHTTTLNSATEFKDGNIKVGVFVDYEEKKFEAFWEILVEELKDLVFQWEKGCIEENIIDTIYDIGDVRDIADIEAFDDEILLNFISKPGGEPQERLQTIVVRCGIILDKNVTLTIPLIKEEMGKLDEFKHLTGLAKQLAIHEKFKQVMKEAAMGKRVKGDKLKYLTDRNVDTSRFGSHGRIWFKTIKGGAELTFKLSLCKAWKNELKRRLLKFVEAILDATKVKSVEDWSFPQDVGEIKNYIDSIPEYT